MTPDPFLQAKHEAMDHVIRLRPVCGLSQIIGQKPVMAFDRPISQRSVGEGGDNGKAVQKQNTKKCEMTVTVVMEVRR